MLTAAFTGHRPDKLGGWSGNSPVAETVRRALADIVRRTLRKYPGASFLSGMAPGVDQWAAESVLAARDQGAQCRLVAVVPFEGQEHRWPEASQLRYRELLRRADEVVVLAPVPSGPKEARRLLLARNRWMVERAGVVLAVWDGSPGGTAHTVRFAAQAGRVVVLFDPRHPEAGWQVLG